VVGVIVDAVNEVLDIPDTDIEPAPDFGTRIRSEFIRGIGKVRGSFVIVLDVDKFLALDELATLPSIDAPSNRGEASSAFPS
jgi:purine-binding chemotaxis protein CheW